MSDQVTFSNQDQFYRLDMDTFTETINRLNENPFTLTSFGDTKVVGNVITSQDSSLLMTTIPYDEGWSVKVDDRETAKQKMLGAFIGVPLSKGQHQVVFTYALPGFLAGCIVSTVSICLAVFFLLGLRKKAPGRNRIP